MQISPPTHFFVGVSALLCVGVVTNLESNFALFSKGVFLSTTILCLTTWWRPSLRSLTTQAFSSLLHSRMRIIQNFRVHTLADTVVGEEPNYCPGVITWFCIIIRVAPSR